MSLPLTALFVDCDSYFASVEQHLDPRLRGRPVGVRPVDAESTCCIAASYEAKRFGVKTGTRVSDARQLCPGIQIVQAKPEQYIRYHHRVIAAVEECIHVEKSLSIDELWAWLPYNWRDTETVKKVAARIKATIARDVSPHITVSIGAAPSRYLAKMASKMRKPNGFHILHGESLPDSLYELEMSDFTGIGRQTELRLHASGIHSVEDLCNTPKSVLHGVWGSVHGSRMYHRLRGMEIPEDDTPLQSIGHSHQLPPHCSRPEKAWPIAQKLLHKACERLRDEDRLTSLLTLQLSSYASGVWEAAAHTPETDSTLRLTEMLAALWNDRPTPRSGLSYVGIVLSRLVAPDNYTPELFQAAVAGAMSEQDRAKHARLDATVDALRKRFGRNAVYMGNVHDARDEAPMRISFEHIPKLELENDVK